MKKRAILPREFNKQRRLDTVGVAGSTPVEPTINNLPNGDKSLGILEDFDIDASFDWIDQTPPVRKDLTRFSKKKCGKSVESLAPVSKK